MLKQILSSPSLKAMESALSASLVRRDVIANNIANVNTPGYKRSAVEFEDMLSEASGDNGKLTLAKTNGKHLDNVPDNNVKPIIKTINDETMRYDGNNVDIDKEVADLAKNTIYYNALTQQIGKQFTSVKNILQQIK